MNRYLIISVLLFLFACGKEEDNINRSTPPPSCAFSVFFEDSISSLNTSFPNFFYQEDGVGFLSTQTCLEPTCQAGSNILNELSNTWMNKNSNFSGNVLVLENNGAWLSLASLGLPNKRIEFDVSERINIGTVNPYQATADSNLLNADVSVLEPGITYQEIPVGTNGGYHIVMEGPISSIFWLGFNIAYDNVCITGL